jgi:hypothetical protein
MIEREEFPRQIREPLKVVQAALQPEETVLSGLRPKRSVSIELERRKVHHFRKTPRLPGGTPFGAVEALES